MPSLLASFLSLFPRPKRAPAVADAFDFTPLFKAPLDSSHRPKAPRYPHPDIPEDATDAPHHLPGAALTMGDTDWTAEAMAELIIDCVNGTGCVTETDFAAAGFTPHDVRTRGEAARDIAILSGKLQRPILMDVG